MNSLPFTNEKIRQVISVVFQQSVSESWVSKFIYRHSKYLTRRIVKGLETRRVCDQTPEMIENWLERYNKFMQIHHFPAHARLNLDETRAVAAGLQTRVVSASSTKANIRISRPRTVATSVPIISADGSVFMSFQVIRMNRNYCWQEAIPRDERLRG